MTFLLTKLPSYQRSCFCSWRSLLLVDTATHCNTFCNTTQHTFLLSKIIFVTGEIFTALSDNDGDDFRPALQRAATRRNTLQHTATRRNTLQHTATHCNTLQHAATHCNTLQHTATLGGDIHSIIRQWWRRLSPCQNGTWISGTESSYATQNDRGFDSCYFVFLFDILLLCFIKKLVPKRKDIRDRKFPSHIKWPSSCVVF